MTQERMIRLPPIPDGVEIYWAKLSFLNHPTEDILIMDDVELEPAPPKDWKPKCYTEWEITGGCAFLIDDVCEKCIYRKKE